MRKDKKEDAEDSKMHAFSNLDKTSVLQEVIIQFFTFLNYTFHTSILQTEMAKTTLRSLVSFERLFSQQLKNIVWKISGSRVQRDPSESEEVHSYLD